MSPFMYIFNIAVLKKEALRTVDVRTGEAIRSLDRILLFNKTILSRALV